MLKSAIDCKAATVVRLEILCARHGIQMPKVRFDLRGSNAGEAYIEERLINLNLKMFREHFQQFVEETIGHELAHIWHWDLKLKGGPHGKEWKQLMVRMGMPPVRCHNFRTDAACSRTGYFLYRCFCGSGNMVGLDMHRKIQENPRAFVCDRCRTRFVYVP